jgi:hypothetical protein
MSELATSTPEDFVLIQGCLAGDQYAWTRLFRRYQPFLLSRLLYGLSGFHDREQLAEEMAADIWRELSTEGARRLRLYSPHRATFVAFLYGFIRMHLRRRFCKPARLAFAALTEEGANAACSSHDEAFWCSRLPIDELTALLSPAERSYLCWLLAGEDRGARPVNRRYGDKLRERMLPKVRRWLDEIRG